MLPLINNHIESSTPYRIAFKGNKDSHKANSSLSSKSYDSFEYTKPQELLCPDNCVFTDIREFLRKDMYFVAGVTETPKVNLKEIFDFNKLLDDEQTDSNTIKDLKDCGVAFPRKVCKNLFSGGKLNSDYVDNKKALDVLRKSGISHIIYLKDEDIAEYRKFITDNGFKFVEPADPLLTVFLDMGEPIEEACKDVSTIGEKFIKYIRNLNEIISKNTSYIGCEYGSVKTSQILYYLSALNDKIKVPDIKITSVMKKNFDYLRRIK